MPELEATCADELVDTLIHNRDELIGADEHESRTTVRALLRKCLTTPTVHQFERDRYLAQKVNDIL
jgi:hypothetical protein